MQSLYHKSILKIQSMFRNKLFKKKTLPNSLFTIQKILKKNNLKFCEISDDGRINSCMDEDKIIKILSKKMPNRIRKPKKRMWYDILVYDYQNSWLPINIKTTTTLTNDNTGNLAMCVYAYTDQKMNLLKTYNNGEMSKILIKKIKNKEFNYNPKKDYYFVVINKEDSNDIIINSINGLTELTPNINNLPFQVCWNKNRDFKYKHITNNINMFLNAIQKPKPSWKENFLSNIRNIKL
jgi:hypothetical protein